MPPYQQYQKARDAAWKTLIACQVSSLPADAKAIAGKLNIALHSLPEDEFLLPDCLKNTDAACFSLGIRGKWHIFIQERKMDDQHVHFSIAHEMGHIILSHATRPIAPGIRIPLSKENAGDIIDDPLSPEDYFADIFAVRLLAPACVLHAMDIHTPQQIMLSCFLPPKAAKIRADRMHLLAERNIFLSHPLERQVYCQFMPADKHTPAPALPLDIPARSYAIPALPFRKNMPPRKNRRWLLYLVPALAAAAVLIFFLLR